MLRRQCKVCGPQMVVRVNKRDEMDFELIPEKTGETIKKVVRPCMKLPGLEEAVTVRVYTVQCSKCDHMWTYRKKIK